MLRSILLIGLCLGSLVIYSPDELKETIEITIFAAFGNPSIYNTVGKLVYSNITSCAVTTALDSMSFALIDVSKIKDNCSLEDIFISTQTQGGIAAVFIMEDERSDELMLPTNASTVDRVTIIGFGITHSQGQKLLVYPNEEIWVSYNYDIVITSDPEIRFYLTGDYTIDQKFFINLQTLNCNATLTTDKLFLGFFYANSNHKGINSTNDCITGDLTYCVPSDNTAKGSDKLLSTVISLNYYNSLQGSQGVTEIISYFIDLYSDCNGNYSQACINQVIISHGATTNASLSILSEAPSKRVNTFTSFFTIDSNLCFWPNYLTDLYCFASSTPSANCPPCSSQCTASDLSGASCSNFCNSSSCGYNNMNCLALGSSCYTFMLGDGNCNAECQNDPDCGLSSSDKLIIIILAAVIGCLV